jgi:arginyl-tRNA synthetase
MLAAEGNTGPYLQYAQARQCSVLRKLEPGEGVRPEAVRVEHEVEHQLALLIAGFGDAVDAVATSLEPHKLCGYLYDLASCFSSFYNNCPILKADVSPEQRASRIALTDLTRRVLVQGMSLLGIDAPERM